MASITNIFQTLSTGYFEELAEETVLDSASLYFDKIKGEDSTFLNSPFLSSAIDQYQSQITQQALDFFIDKLVDNLLIGAGLAAAYIAKQKLVSASKLAFAKKSKGLGAKIQNKLKALKVLSTDPETLRGAQSILDTASYANTANTTGYNQATSTRDSATQTKQLKNQIDQKALHLATAKKQAVNEAFFNLAKLGKLDYNNRKHRKLAKQVIGRTVTDQKDFDDINKVFATDYIKDAKTNIIKTAAQLHQERLTAEGYINV